MAMKKGGATYFYHYNAHGDVIALTDAQGNVVARYEYDTWGRLLSKSGEMADENPYRYAGYQYDEETGFYYLIARYYHPTHGVFLSLDPDLGDADDILTQNGYTYANNNPVMLVDLDGHYAIGVYFIPGIGEVALLVTGMVVLGGITYKVGSWLGKRAKECYLKAQNNKQVRKRIEGLEKQIKKHKEKISKNPNSTAVKHWEKEIEAWEKEIARLKKRLKK
ncbi:RHS repeat-associated protein [Geobacillus sp. C56-T2]|nr:RHS repeat-associated protein [Geobacillus sp. C56-T2]